MSKIFTKETNIIIALFFFLSLIPFLWFPDNQILLGYDNIYPLNPIAFLKDRMYSWTSILGFGMDQSGVQGSLIIHGIDALPQLLGFSYQASQKIVFSLWFFLLLLSPYILVRRLEKYGFIKTPYLKVFFPILYAINFYILQAWWIAERTKFSLVVVTPLFLAVLFPLIKESISTRKVIKASLICSLLLSFFNGGSWGGLSLYGGLILTLFCFFIFFCLLFLIQKKKKEILHLILFLCFFTVSFIALNAYTLLPFIMYTFKQYSNLVTSAGGVSGLISWTRYLSENTSFINLFRLQGIPDWYNNGSFHPYSRFYIGDTQLIFLSFLFPLFLFLSFLNKGRENKSLITFFLFLFLTSLFLSAGTHHPLGSLFEILMTKIPGFIIFRSAIFKFGYVYWLTFSFFAGLFLSHFIELISNKVRMNLSRPTWVVSCLLLVLLILGYHFPYLTGDIFFINQTSSSRVKLPSYIGDFSKWWEENGKGERVLNLPRLNQNWLFEQYNWKYLSLFPVLGNYANEGIIENTELINQPEEDIVEDLYNAISRNDQASFDMLASIVGIRYFLVRKDFNFNTVDEETDDPVLLEKNLLLNPNISKVKSFGQWVLYKHKDQKPLFFAKNDADVILGTTPADKEIYNTLTVDEEAFNAHPETVSRITVSPECLSCKAEKEESQITFPKPKILIDSTFYEFIKLREQFSKKKNLSVEAKTFEYIGETLKWTSQVNELILQDRSEYYINTARDSYIDLFKKLQDITPDIKTQASNPYSTIAIMEQYLEAERKYLEDLTSSVNKRSTIISLQKMLYMVDGLDNDLKSFYSPSDINRKKIYKFNVPISGEFNIRVGKDTLGVLTNLDPDLITLSVDRSPIVKTKTDGNYLDFGTFFLTKGEHEFTLYVPAQKNVLLESVNEKILGKNCFSSYYYDYSPDKIYSLEFNQKNNFDSDFFFIVDDGVAFSSALSQYFPISIYQFKKQRYIISPNTLNLGKTLNKLRVSFCATNLNDSFYRENVRDLSLTELTNPKISATRQQSIASSIPPRIEFSRVDQTHYKVNVSDAKSPFYLLFVQRFSPNWQTNIGEHYVGNGFENVWYLDKKGSYSFDIVYTLQSYFYKGFAISVISLIVVVYFMLKKEKNT